MPAAQRRHPHERKAILKADLRAIMAAPHIHVDKAVFTQMIVVMRTAGLKRLPVLHRDFAKW